MATLNNFLGVNDVTSKLTTSYYTAAISGGNAKIVVLLF